MILCIDATMFRYVSSLCVLFSLFCYPRKATMKNFPPVLCCDESALLTIYWESAEISLHSNLVLFILNDWLLKCAFFWNDNNMYNKLLFRFLFGAVKKNCFQKLNLSHKQVLETRFIRTNTKLCVILISPE